MEFLLSVFLQWFDRPITLQLVLLAIAPLPPQVERWWFSTKFDLWLLFGRLLGGAQMTNNGFWCLNLHNRTLWTYGCWTNNHYLRWSLLGFQTCKQWSSLSWKGLPSFHAWGHLYFQVYSLLVWHHWMRPSLVIFVCFGVTFPWDLFKPNIIKVGNQILS